MLEAYLLLWEDFESFRIVSGLRRFRAISTIIADSSRGRVADSPAFPTENSLSDFWNSIDCCTSKEVGAIILCHSRHCASAMSHVSFSLLDTENITRTQA